MTYIPNFAEPRIRRRCLQVLGWSAANLSTDKPRFWTRKQLDKRFGQQQNLLTGSLRSWLLIPCSNYSWQQGIAKTYMLNEKNYLWLDQQLNPRVTVSNPDLTALDWASKEYLQELTTGEFSYQDQSHRLWNDLQRIPTRIRRPLFIQHGYRYEYDIQACAPTLIYQYAEKSGLTRPTPHLKEYLADRTEFRSRLQQDIACTADQAKRIITALFSGARLGPGNAIAALLNNDPHKIQTLSGLSYIKDLQKDIKKCWDKIKLQEGSKRLSSRDKWLIYFRLERSVMDEIRHELKKRKIRCFLEHDGWRCSEVIDPIELEAMVRRTTGYHIRLEWQIYEDV